MQSEKTFGQQLMALENRMKESGFTTFLDWEEFLDMEVISTFEAKHKVKYHTVEIMEGVMIGVFTNGGIS